MVMYSSEKLENLKSKKKAYIASMLIAVAVCIIVCTALCFAVNRDNTTLIILLNSIITVLCGWFVIGCFFAFFTPCRARIVHTEGILASEPIVCSGEIKKADETVTAERYIKATKVLISDGEDHIFYWDNSIGDCPFTAGDTVQLTVRRNFIFAYEAETYEV